MEHGVECLYVIRLYVQVKLVDWELWLRSSASACQIIEVKHSGSLIHYSPGS